MRTISAEVAREVKRRTSDVGWRQVDLASALGLSQPQVSRKLNGTTAFTVDELCVIADLVGCRVADLIPEPGGPPASSQRVVVLPPLRWQELTREEKVAWALGVVAALGSGESASE